MSRNIQRRGIAAAVLIVALVLGSPAHAAGLMDSGHVPTLFHQAWQWLASVLPGGGPETRPSPPAQGSWRQKAVTSTDPTQPVKATADKSAGVDPNG
jgi:hypothetical protein